MYKCLTKALLLVLSGLMVLGNSGCGGKTASKATDETAKIKWYLMFQDQKGLPEIQEEMNKIIKEKINAEVQILRLDPSSYLEKIKMIIASNEDFDLLFTSPNYQYNNFVKKGAIMDIGDMIKQYAPKSYAQIPAEYWDAAKVNGKIYGFINYQIVGRQNGFVIQKSAVDKYNFDISTIKEFKDIEPLLKKIKENEAPNVVPIYISKVSYLGVMKNSNIYPVDDTEVAGIMEDGSNDYTVFNTFEHPKFIEALKLMRSWYQKGYIESDASTITNARERLGKGLTMAWYDMVGPGFEPSFEKILGGKPVVTKITEQPFVTTNSIIATMQGVSKTSKNPQKAIQLLELINTNEQNIYNIMNFGIEGKHYTKVGENRIEPTKDSEYFPNMAWEFGNQFNAYLMPGQNDTLWDDTKNINNTAKKSKLLGFVFDNEPVKAEIAMCTSVIGEYLPGLATGSLDTDTYYPAFIEKLKNAGMDKIVQETQRQIDEWRTK